MIEKEIWKDIPGYEGRYQISDSGKVKSLARVSKSKYPGGNPVKMRILKSTINPGGYEVVILCKDAKTKCIGIHRLIATAFIPTINGKDHINHKNGNRLDNTIENLEWCTNQENQTHSWKHNSRQPLRGENNGHAKIKPEDVVEIRRLRSEGYTYIEIGKRFNLSRPSVQDIIYRRTWKHVA